MLCVRFPPSLRNVEDAQCSIDVSHEAGRHWWNRFGPMFCPDPAEARAAHADPDMCVKRAMMIHANLILDSEPERSAKPWVASRQGH